MSTHGYTCIKQILSYCLLVLKFGFRNRFASGTECEFCNLSDFEKDFWKYSENHLDKHNPEFDEKSFYNYFKSKNITRH